MGGEQKRSGHKRRSLPYWGIELDQAGPHGCASIGNEYEGCMRYFPGMKPSHAKQIDLVSACRVPTGEVIDAVDALVVAFQGEVGVGLAQAPHFDRAI